MKLKRYDEGLAVRLGESISGTLPARVEYESYDADGKFIAFGSAQVAFDNSVDVELVGWTGVNDGSVYKITGVTVFNQDLGVPHTVDIFRKKSPNALYQHFHAALQSNGLLMYEPETGWRVYDGEGIQV